MNTHDMIELPQGYAERPFDYSGDLYTEGQVRAIDEAYRKRRGEQDHMKYKATHDAWLEYVEQAIAEASALRAAATRARKSIEMYIEISKKEATRLDCKATDVATLEGMAEGARRAALYMEDVFKALHGEGQP